MAIVSVFWFKMRIGCTRWAREFPWNVFRRKLSLKCHSQTHLAIERAIKSFGQMFRFGEKYIIKSVFKNWKLFSLLECIVLWHPNQVHWNVVLLHKNCKKGFFLFCQSLWSVIIFANPNLQSSHCLGFEDDCASRPDRSCTNRYELWTNYTTSYFHCSIFCLFSL